jgi:hypothetical protein
LIAQVLARQRGRYADPAALGFVCIFLPRPRQDLDKIDHLWYSGLVMKRGARNQIVALGSAANGQCCAWPHPLRPVRQILALVAPTSLCTNKSTKESLYPALLFPTLGSSFSTFVRLILAFSALCRRRPSVQRSALSYKPDRPATQDILVSLERTLDADTSPIETPSRWESILGRNAKHSTFTTRAMPALRTDSLNSSRCSVDQSRNSPFITVLLASAHIREKLTVTKVLAHSRRHHPKTHLLSLFCRGAPHIRENSVFTNAFHVAGIPKNSGFIIVLPPRRSYRRNSAFTNAFRHIAAISQKLTFYHRFAAAPHIRENSVFTNAFRHVAGITQKLTFYHRFAAAPLLHIRENPVFTNAFRHVAGITQKLTFYHRFVPSQPILQHSMFINVLTLARRCAPQPPAAVAAGCIWRRCET